jgi:hypothetical protein
MSSTNNLDWRPWPLVRPLAVFGTAGRAIREGALPGS